MHLYYFTLQRQTEFLQHRFKNARIVDSYTQMKNEWVIELEQKGTEKGVLLLSANGNFPFLLFIEKYQRGKNSTEVMKEMIGLQIRELLILPGERIVKMLFKDSQLQLIVQLFTHNSNFFLLDASEKIVNCFKGCRHNTGKAYLFPQQDRLDPVQLSAAQFCEMIKERPEQTFIEWLRQFQFMPAVIIKEICCRSGIKEDTRIQDTAEIDWQNLYQQLQIFRNTLFQQLPRVYLTDEMPVRLALTPLKHLGDMAYREFENINEALRFYNFRAFKYQKLTQKKQRLLQLLQYKHLAVCRKLTKMKNRFPGKEKKEHYQRIGQLMISQPQLFAAGKKHIELVDYFDPALKTFPVKIDPQLSAAENAALYFRKAKEWDDKRRQYQRSYHDLLKQSEQLAEMLKTAENMDSFKKVERFEIMLKEMRLLQADAAEQDRFYLPYKRYAFRGYEIWVGRNARDNDSLTFKHANKEDFWLHVQGCSGSHVIVRNPLKRASLPADILEHAAILAVRFSAAKHVSYAPVIHTSVKHVRKPRKSLPGSVVPSHTKTIFVDPLSPKN